VRTQIFFLLCVGKALVCSTTETDFKLGIENCIVQFPAHKLTQGKKARIGLVANQTSYDQKGSRSIDLLLQNKFNVVQVFVTEHGFKGTIAASKEVDNSYDTETNIPIVSLYGKKKGADRIGLIANSDMHKIDCLIFDIQEAGMRHYTYLDTLLKVMQSAAQHNKPIIVCDRPNFLGHRMEGPQGNPRIFKKETVGSLPLRHGMTVGEVARYFNEHVLQKKSDLYVMPMSCYTRTMDTKKHYKNHLSPNITSVEAVHGYSFLGVLGEVRPFDLGIGSEKAFQCILLPDDHPFTVDQWEECRGVLKKRGIESSHYRYFSARKKKWYRGLHIMITNIMPFRSFETLLDILEFFKKNNVQLALSAYFDTAVGNAQVRLWIDGKRTKEQVINDSKNEVKLLLERLQHQLLYYPLPHITKNGMLHETLPVAMWGFA